MAKIVKDTRETIDIDSELENIKKTNKKVKKDTKSETKPKKKNTKKRKTKKHGKIITFFKDVKAEMSKVKWPSRKDMVKYSLATILFIIFFALFFYLIDLIIALLKAGV